MKSEVYIEHRNSRKEKASKEWSNRMALYCMSMIGDNRASEISDRKQAIAGSISDDYYTKVLNPYNASDKKYTKHRADMRNYDIMKDVIRRYMGEFSKQPFDFQVKCNDPEVITRFNDTLASRISEIAVQQFINKLNEQGIQTGQESKEVPDFQEFFTKFKKEYVDDMAIQGQNLLTAIIDWTDSKLLYYTSFYNFIVLGQTFTYRDVRNGQIFKESIDPEDYYPISNGKAFIEDHNMGVRGFKVTIPELLENFSDVLSEDVYNRIIDLFKNYKTSGGGVSIPLSLFKSKFDDKTYATFLTNGVSRIANDYYSLTNKDNTIDGYHMVYTTQVKVANVVLIDPITGQMREDIVETDSFQLDPNKGHVSVTYEWINEVWEQFMFGSETDDIITPARPITYQRRDANNKNTVKLPYNGLCEVVPGTGFTFSIPDAILPFQLSRNIFAFYRERIIAKNKDKIMIVPQSLLGDTASQENKIYRMENSSIFPYDDSEDESGQKAQHIRILDASLSQFISHITDLIDRMKAEAWDTVDMNPQRYGDIDTSAGKGTTEEAIVRSSMGSVIIFTMFEKFLEKEYIADLEYSKVAYVNGKKGAYTDNDGNTRFLDLDVDNHILANYGLHVVSSVSQIEKKRGLQNLALAAAQNGNFKLGVDAILKDNVSAIAKSFEEFEEANRTYQASIANEKEQILLKNTQTIAENDQANRDSNMEIAVLKDRGDTERELIKSRVNLANLSASNAGTTDPNVLSELDRQKLAIDKMALDLENRKHNDEMAFKDKELKAKEKIEMAKVNKPNPKK